MYKLIYREENMLPYPCTFSNSEWVKTLVTVTDNVIESSTGEVVADKIIPNSFYASHYIGESVARDATEYTAFSVELKAAELYDAQIYVIDSTASSNLLTMRVNLSTGNIISAAHDQNNAVLTDWIFEHIGSGWYLVGLAGIIGPSTGGNINPRITIASSGTLIYSGNGVSGIYACNARLMSSSVIRNAIDLCPDWNFSFQDEKVQQRHKAVSGIHEVYKYGDFDARKFDLRYVSSSDASIINSWWSSNAELILRDSVNYSVFSCLITNRNIPIGQVIKPYSDQFRGVIELGEY